MNAKHIWLPVSVPLVSVVFVFLPADEPALAGFQGVTVHPPAGPSSSSVLTMIFAAAAAAAVLLLAVASASQSSSAFLPTNV